jgi:4-hydroxyproline epimerase
MGSAWVQRVAFVDSHTAGEPTRVVLSGGPDLGEGPTTAQLELLRGGHDEFRRGVVLEPRGSDVLVGAVLTRPAEPSSVTGVIFFNNVGYLGMCGHGTIGVVETLRHLGRIGPGLHRIETVVGIVTATLEESGEVTLENVPSHREAAGVEVEAQGLGRVVGDVAWGGNWFYLVKHHGLPLDLANAAALTDAAWKIRVAVNNSGHPEVDHVELFGPPKREDANARNFVLCPGKAYDRSPCGTGTSAKLACLAASGELAEGEPWVQEGVSGECFRGSYRWIDRKKGVIAPRIGGRAHVTAEGTLLFSPEDPFRAGLGGV